MKSTDYVAKRLARLAAETRVEMGRPTVKNHPDAELLMLMLGRAATDLEAAGGVLEHAPEVREVPISSTPAEGDSGPVRFAFIATGRDGFAGPEIYAQDEAGSVWAGGDEGIKNAHRFTLRADADRIGSTRGGYAYPIPA